MSERLLTLCVESEAQGDALMNIIADGVDGGAIAPAGEVDLVHIESPGASWYISLNRKNPMPDFGGYDV